MRFNVSLRGLSLGFATAAFLAASAAWALPTPASSSSTMSSTSWLAGVTARLDHQITTQSARKGERIEAKLDHDVTTPDGTKLDGGTELLGTVTAVKASQDGGPSKLSVRFDKAEMKDGKVIPVKVTLTGAYPNDSSQLQAYGESSMGPAERHVSLKDRFDQEPGTLNHIAMISRASGQNSATFSRKSGDITLRNGTFLQVGIARAQSSTSNMSKGM